MGLGFDLNVYAWLDNTSCQLCAHEPSARHNLRSDYGEMVGREKRKTEREERREEEEEEGGVEAFYTPL